MSTRLCALACALACACGCVLLNPEYGETLGGTTSSTSSGTTSGGATTSGTSGGGTLGETSGSATTASATTSGASDGTSTGAGCADVDMVPLYVDGDDDGHGAGAATVMTICPGDTPPDGYSLIHDDCDDGDGQVYPGAPEASDMADNNCDGLIDEGSDGIADMFYQGCRRTSLNDHFYWVCAEATNPSKANDKCLAFAVPQSGASAFHAKIESMEVHELLATLLDGDTSFGLTEDVFKSKYRWVADGAPLSGFGAGFGAYPWIAGQPDSLTEKWIVMKFSGAWGWNDAQDSNPRAFICEGVPAP
ncbi:MAG: hypothetical protein KC420_07115 [Myxococcales bacterium]|nr:hypothetical protein [Myxococcales bacterium]